MLNIINKFNRERRAMLQLRQFRSNDLIDMLADLFIEHGSPEYIRFDKGPEFVANAMRGWLGGWRVPHSALLRGILPR
ncbi:transposase family protein, partial [Acetobacter sp. TBRC 12305]|nr:hypothetical protein [Acetobacter garciniae]MBX0345243.1 transposase family protein [Acetobacter garciniae]